MSFEPRSIVNGALLRQFVGKNVSVFVKLEGDYTGQSVKGQTTDKHSIRIDLPEPLNGRPADWVEVIGKVAGPDTINAREVILFEEGDQEFDDESHNLLVQIMNNCQEFYRTS